MLLDILILRNLLITAVESLIFLCYNRLHSKIYTKAVPHEYLSRRTPHRA